MGVKDFVIAMLIRLGFEKQGMNWNQIQLRG